MTKFKSAFLLIAHGSRDPEDGKHFFELVESFKKVRTDKLVAGAFLEFAEPRVPEVIDQCVGLGVNEIFVIPLMVFGGKHLKEDVPRLMQEAKTKYPVLDFHYGGCLSDHPMFLQFLEAKTKKMESQI